MSSNVSNVIKHCACAMKGTKTISSSPTLNPARVFSNVVVPINQRHLHLRVGTCAWRLRISMGSWRQTFGRFPFFSTDPI